MIILGLAGPGEPSKRHALATAELMNKMVPQHLSALTYMCEPGTPMYQDVQQGKFKMLTPRQVLEETRLLLANIHEGPIHFTSNHASNYLAFNDTIPDKTPEMLAKIDSVLAGKSQMRPEWSRGL